MAINDGKVFGEPRTDSGDSVLDDTNNAVRVNIVSGSFTVPPQSGVATEATLSSLNSKVTKADTDNVTIVSMPGVVVAPSTNPTRVYAATGWPLPSGAATESTLTTLNNKVPSQGQAAMAASTPVVIASNQSAIPVTGSFSTTPSTDATRVYIATGLPLPSGAATAALQTQPGIDIGDVTVNNGVGASAVNIQDGGNSITVDGSLSPSTDPTRVFASTGWPLPSGAATSVLQTQPGVDIGDVTVNNGTGASGVNIQDGGNSITVDGIVSVIPPTDPTRVFAATGWPLPSGAATESTLSTLNGKITACDTGSVTIASLPNEGQQTMANSISVAIASNQSAITVTGDLTIGNDDPIRVYSSGGWPLPSGASTAALQTQPGVDIGDVTINNAAGSSAVNVQDGGNSLTVDGSVIIIPDNPVRVYSTGTWPLPSGAATEATLSTLNGKITACDTGSVTIAALPNEGQQTMANSISVAIASNQSVISVSDGGGSITVDGDLTIGNDDPLRVYASTGWPLPSGAATAALQTQPGIDIGDVTINNAAGAAAVNVQDGGNSITVDGSVIIIPDNPIRIYSTGTWPLPSGASTAALQTQPGVDIGDVTINNAAGSSAVNVQDGGNSLTVDGAVIVIPDNPLRVYSTGTWPLPSGASTEATLLLNTTATQGISGTVYQQATGAITKGLLVMGYDTVVPRAFSVDTSGRQIVSSIPGNPNPVYISSGLVLPSGASTETTLSTLSTTVSSLSKAEDSAHSTGDAGILQLCIRNDAGTVLTSTNLDYSALTSDSQGNLRTNMISGVSGHGKSLKSKTGSASATFTLVAAVASKKIKVNSLSLITAATTAVTVTFKDGAAGTALATYPMQAITGTNFGITENLAVPSSLFETTANTLLEMAFSTAQTVTYNLRYWDDDIV